MSDEPDPRSDRTRRGLRLAALSAAQVVSWGILYYALIVASPAVADDTGWPLALVTALFSLGLIVSAVAGIVVGRMLDSRGPRTVMTVGSVIGVVGFSIVAVAPNPVVFAVGWVVAGVASAAVLYQAAFTVIARRYGARRHGPMTIVTLAGGLASTVFAPVVAGLLTATDWRTTFLILAGVLAGVTIPIHALTLERSWTPTATVPGVEAPQSAQLEGLKAAAVDLGIPNYFVDPRPTFAVRAEALASTLSDDVWGALKVDRTA